MIGKYSPQELITPEEAIALFEYGTIAEMYTAKALFDIYRHKGSYSLYAGAFSLSATMKKYEITP